MDQRYGARLCGFVPVDEENSLMDGASTNPSCPAACANGEPDRQMVQHLHRNRPPGGQQQLPKKTEFLKMGEILTQGDQAILAYRRQRHALKQKAAP